MEHVGVLGAVILSIVPSFPLSAAQHVAIGPQVAFADYKEVSSDLHYRGSGIAAKATLQWQKFSADVVLSKVKYKPTSDGTATQEFDASEVDVRLRYYVTGPISAELGFLNRKADPEFEAQSVGAVTAGARVTYLLGPGVRMALHGGLLFGSKFSGGGSTGALGALQLGLGLTVDALRGRVQGRATTDSSASRGRPTMEVGPSRPRSSSPWVALASPSRSERALCGGLTARGQQGDFAFHMSAFALLLVLILLLSLTLLRGGGGFVARAETTM